MYYYRGSYEDLESNANMVMGHTINQLYVDGYLTEKQYNEVTTSYVANIKKEKGLMSKIRKVFFPPKEGEEKDLDKIVFMITRINLKHHE